MRGHPLSDDEIRTFIEDGFVRLDQAFSASTAESVRHRLWRDMGGRPDDATTWTKPVVRLGMYTDAPFVEAANTPVLQGAFDALVGPDRWLPCGAMGTFPIRFPSPEDPGDAGWHVDASFGFDDPNFMNWRINVESKGRALLMLFLFSDVGPDDAPTRIRVGSHLDIARALAPAGSSGLSLGELAATDFAGSATRAEAFAVGDAGTVYLCHPFLVHSAQMHRGTRPRFMAQPPLLPREPLAPLAPLQNGGPHWPVERAIRHALALDD